MSGAKFGGVRWHMDIMRSCYVSKSSHKQWGYGHILVPTWARWLAVYLGGPVSWFQQWYGGWMWHERGWPYWPLRTATWLLDRITDPADRLGTPFRWNAPDSGEPNEIGFWTPSDGTRQRSEIRVFVS